MPGTRRTEAYGADTVEYYSRSCATGDSLVANLRFAFRHKAKVLIAGYDPMVLARASPGPPPAR